MNESITSQSRQRPTFLNVLCVIGFIWVGLSIIGNALSYVGMKMLTSGTMEEVIAETGDENALTQYEEAMEKLAASGLDAHQMSSLMGIGMVLTIVVLVGLIMMWRLKRIGFFVYSGAQVLGIFSPLFLGGDLPLSGMELVTTAIVVLFIILFALNLKHMR